jgi:hypothetical protein
MIKMIILSKPTFHRFPVQPDQILPITTPANITLQAEDKRLLRPTHKMAALGRTERKIRTTIIILKQLLPRRSPRAKLGAFSLKVAPKLVTSSGRDVIRAKPISPIQALVRPLLRTIISPYWLNFVPATAMMLAATASLNQTIICLTSSGLFKM